MVPVKSRTSIEALIKQNCSYEARFFNETEALF